VSLRITDECINCGACEEACPTAAISEDTENDVRVINTELCTECVGFYGRTMCRVECPVECIEPISGQRQSEDALIAKARALFPDHTFPAEPPSHFR
jgi:ferredoxin